MNGRTRIGIAALLASMILACTGHDWTIPGRLPVEVALPTLPAAYGSPAGTWRISWWDGVAVRMIRKPLGTGTVALETATDGAALVVVVAEAEVQPAPGLTAVLAPYGGWAAPGDREATLARERGELAAVLLRLGARGLDPSLINVERLARLVVVECGAEGTRVLDTERLAEALGSGEMRSSDVDALAPIRWEFRLGGDAAQVWLTDEPVAPELVLTPAGGFVAGAVELVPRELRRFWRREEAPLGATQGATATGGVALLTVAADEDDHVTAVLTHHVVDELVRDGDHLEDLFTVQELRDPLVGGGE